MSTDLEILRNRPVSDEEFRRLELKVERDAGFWNGALSVFTIVLLAGAFWIGFQTGPVL